MEIEYQDPRTLAPYKKNSRVHSSEQVKQIIQSIKEYGFTNPILIDERGMIIAGHGRLKAAMELKMKEVPCIRLTGLTEAQKKAYVIADNKMALNASWDLNMLADELEELKGLDYCLELTGFSDSEINDILGEGGEETCLDNEYEEKTLKENNTKLHTCPECGCEFED